MADIVVTVPKNFRYGDLRGLAAWLDEGDVPGSDWEDEGENYHVYTTHGPKPKIDPGGNMTDELKPLAKDYLGDGVSVSFDGYQLHLTNEGGLEGNSIFLDPQVYGALLRYVERINRERGGSS